MKTIYFIRSAPYEYSIKGNNLYRSFDLVAAKVVDPVLKKKDIHMIHRIVPGEVFESKVVISAPERRSIQTARLINKNVFVFPELREVGYRMENFISEKDFYTNNKPNINKARRNFVTAFIDNKTEESFDQIIERIQVLLRKISIINAFEIALVSHGFVMKVIESYVRDQSIENNPKKLLKFFSGKSETFKFCEGFILESDNGKFTFKSYIKNNESL